MGDWDHHVCMDHHWQALKALFVPVSLGVGTVCYLVIVVVGLRHSPGSVQRRNFFRAALYPSNFVISFGPILVTYYKPQLFADVRWLAAAMSLESSSGLLNVLCCSWQTSLSGGGGGG